jgi:hypothetical protein
MHHRYFERLRAIAKSVPQRLLKPSTRKPFTARLNRLRKNSGWDRKDVPQGLKPDVFSILYGPTKVVP